MHRGCSSQPLRLLRAHHDTCDVQAGAARTQEGDSSTHSHPIVRTSIPTDALPPLAQPSHIAPARSVPARLMVLWPTTMFRTASHPQTPAIRLAIYHNSPFIAGP